MEMVPQQHRGLTQGTSSNQPFPSQPMPAGQARLSGYFIGVVNLPVFSLVVL